MPDVGAPADAPPWPARPAHASAFLAETLARIGGGAYSTPSKLTVAEYLTAEWLPAVAGTLRPLSVTQYEQAIRLRIVPYIGAVRLQRYPGAHLNTVYADLERAGSQSPHDASRMPSSVAPCATPSDEAAPAQRREDGGPAEAQRV